MHGRVAFVLLVLLACQPACRFRFDRQDDSAGDGSLDGRTSGDGLPALPDGDIDDDALTAAMYPSFGPETGPLTYGSGCTGGGGLRRVMYGDLPNGASQDQTITFDYVPSSLMVVGVYTGNGQTPAVSIAVRDTNNGAYLLMPDGVNSYGSWCSPNVSLGTYTIQIVNEEPSQVARNLAITIAVGLDGLATCPYQGC